MTPMVACAYMYHFQHNNSIMCTHRRRLWLHVHVCSHVHTCCTLMASYILAVPICLPNTPNSKILQAKAQSHPHNIFFDCQTILTDGIILAVHDTSLEHCSFQMQPSASMNNQSILKDFSQKNTPHTLNFTKNSESSENILWDHSEDINGDNCTGTHQLKLLVVKKILS